MLARPVETEHVGTWFVSGSNLVLWLYEIFPPIENIMSPVNVDKSTAPATSTRNSILVCPLTRMYNTPKLINVTVYHLTGPVAQPG